MSPLAWTLQALLHPAALAVALLVKWWTIWFVFGRNFTRTSAMCLSALGASALSCWWVISSQALGTVTEGDPAADLTAGSWWTSFAVAVLATLALETAILRWWMARLVRPDWSWRNYDRLGYGFAHLIAVALAVLFALWQAGAFRVS